MNHCRAVRVPIMMIRGPRPFHRPVATKKNCTKNYINILLHKEIKSRLHWFCYTPLHDWSRKLSSPSSWPITSQTKTCSITLSRFYSQSLSSYWLLEIFFYVLIGFFDYFGLGLTLEKGNRTFHSQLTRSLDGCASDVIVQLGHHSISRVRHDRAEYTS